MNSYKKLLVFATMVLPMSFTSQAPLAKWSDLRQQDGCEEASVVMAMSWVKGEKLIKKEEAEKSITAISDFELKKYGEYRDISLADLRQWVFIDYFKYDAKKVRVVENIKLENLKAEISKGNLILVPTDGRLLKNPYFKAPGPETHMLVLKGYDKLKKEFITNDPGTKRGEGYRYLETILFKAIKAYPTGHHLPVKKIEKKMLVVEK
ncbi:MAG: C39 family peptidase [Candidatus Falkowbacteria bacterium]|nr:C39 family peptidase [Candidatus Falkowbacteria bacterium]